MAYIYIETFRTLPLVMVLIGFYLVIPEILRNLFNLTGDIRLQAAIISFSLFEAAYFSEILRSGINAVARNQFQAAKALGFTSLQTYRLIILPQAIKNTFPALLTQCIILFQDVALVYVIGLPDFFGMAVKIGARDGAIVEAILFASIIYFVICYILQRVVNRLKQATSLYEVK
jgi:glutamate/aspartate transport system permease protein